MTKKTLLFKLFCLVVIFSFHVSPYFVYAQEPSARDSFDDRLGSVYTLAVTMYKKGNYDRAKPLFEKIYAQNPTYRLTAKYLQEMAAANTSTDSGEKNAEVAQEDSKNKIFQVYKQGVYLFNIKKYERAQEKFETFLKAYPGQEHALNYLMKTKEALAQKRKKMDLSMKVFESNMKKEKAREENTQARLKAEDEAKQKAEKAKQKRKLAALYRIAKRDYGKRKYEKAEEYFLKIKSLNPEYKSTQKYLDAINDLLIEKKEILRARIDKQINQELEIRMLVKKRSEKEIPQEVTEKKEKNKKAKEAKYEVKKIYEAAKALYKSKKYNLAKRKFLEVQMLSPDHKPTARYLRKIGKIESKRDQEFTKKKVEVKEKEVSEAKELTKVSIQKQRTTPSVKELREKADLDFKESDEYLKALEKKIENARKKILTADLGVKKELDSQLEESAQSSKERKAEFFYASAVENYNNKKYEQAKKDFELVESLSPDLKATRSYLMMIDRKLEEEQSTALNQGFEKKYQKGIDLYNRGKFQSALNDFEDLAKTNSRYKDLSQYIKKANERLSRMEKRDKEKTVKALYKDGVKLYKSKQYQRALEKFIAVDGLIAGYKSTKKYFNRIAKRIDKQTSQEIKKVAKMNDQKATVINAKFVTPLTSDEKLIKEAVEKREKEALMAAAQKYRSALAFYNNKNFVEAKLKFIEVESIYPGYKDTETFLQQIDDDIVKANIQGAKQGIQKSEKSWIPSVFEKNLQGKGPNPFNREAEDVYNQALNYYKQKDYARAKSKFEEVKLLIPNFKKTEKYLKKANKYVRRMKRKDRAAEMASAFPKMSDKVENQVQTDKHLDSAENEKNVKSEKQVISSRKMKKADYIMDKAFKHYREGNYKKAQKEFIAVDKMIPDYKSSRRYIVTLDKIISEDERKTNFAKAQREDKSGEEVKEKTLHEDKLISMYESKVANQKAIREEAEKSRAMLREQRQLFNKEQVKVLRDQIQRQEKFTAMKKKEKEQMQARILKEKYAEAKRYYKQNNFTLAKLRFNEIRMIDSNYKSVKKYLKAIDKKVEEAQKFLIERMKKKKELDAQSPQNAELIDVNFKKKNKVYNEKIVQEIIQEEVPKAEQPVYEYSKKDAIKFLEAQESKDYRKRWKKKKKEKERLAKLEEKRKQEAKKKLEEKLAKEKKAREQKLAEEKKAKRKEAKEKVEKVFKEALAHYNAKEAKKYLKKTEQFNKLLENDLFDVAYVKGIKKDFENEKFKIQERHEKERQAREENLKKEEERIAREQEKLEKKREENLAKIEKRIKKEEERIAKEREKEQERLKSAELRDLSRKRIKSEREVTHLLSRSELDSKITHYKSAHKRSVNVDVDYVHPLLKEVKNAQAKRRQELKRTIESKNKSYDKAVLKADKDFKSTLEALYDRAVKLFNEKSYFDANRIFKEIKGMSPSYKNTADYINKSQRKISFTMERGMNIDNPFSPSKQSFELPAVMVYPK